MIAQQLQELNYNYIRPHMSLDNDIPANKTRIEIRINNTWKTIIQNTSLNNKK